MRHRKKINHLGRKTAHRKAMLANMASSLIQHKKVHTTLAKAKALKIYVEPLITKAKEDTTHSRRVVFSYLKDKEAVTELFREISVKVANRPGGYTRILKTGNRLGDNAEMCFIELVDYNENMLGESAAAKKSTRKRRGGAKKKANTAEKEVVAAVTESEAPVAEVAATEEETPSVVTDEVADVTTEAKENDEDSSEEKADK